MRIDKVKGPWFSFGIHVDFEGPYVDIHFIWWIVSIGRLYPALGNGAVIMGVEMEIEDDDEG